MGAVVLLLAVEASCGAVVAAVTDSIVVTVDIVGFGACGDSRRVELPQQTADIDDSSKTLFAPFLLLSDMSECSCAGHREHNRTSGERRTDSTAT